MSEKRNSLTKETTSITTKDRLKRVVGVATIATTIGALGLSACSEPTEAKPSPSVSAEMPGESTDHLTDTDSNTSETPKTQQVEASKPSTSETPIARPEGWNLNDKALEDLGRKVNATLDIEGIQKDAIDEVYMDILDKNDIGVEVKQDFIDTSASEMATLDIAKLNFFGAYVEDNMSKEDFEDKDSPAYFRYLAMKRCFLGPFADLRPDRYSLIVEQELREGNKIPTIENDIEAYTAPLYRLPEIPVWTLDHLKAEGYDSSKGYYAFSFNKKTQQWETTASSEVRKTPDGKYDLPPKGAEVMTYYE